MKKNLGKLKKAIIDLYKSVFKLQSAFPGRKFTPDGRMVGDIGEAIAALEFGVILDKKIKKHWDGHRVDSMGIERKIQIKTTQKDETYLKKPPCEGDLLIFKIFSNGKWRCCYDGPIVKVWRSLKNKNLDNTGAKIITLEKLKVLWGKKDSYLKNNFRRCASLCETRNSAAPAGRQGFCLGPTANRLNG
ncbi:hypothetical protein KKB43_00595 [Patescibacteria group bacterium]|nr:hypothetical protein [Patescibacteria group bacterium]MBU4579497.1 hypothetical protein [Patescibacteria group bacterium]